MNEAAWFGGTAFSVRFLYWDTFREDGSLFVESALYFPLQLHLFV